MKAKFAGRCAKCNQGIVVGTDITKASDDRWVHWRCCDAVWRQGRAEARHESREMSAHPKRVVPKWTRKRGRRA